MELSPYSFLENYFPYLIDEGKGQWPVKLQLKTTFYY